MTAWTFIAWPNNRISIARHRAGGRRDSIAQNVQSGAISRVRSHKRRPLGTFQFEQLQWWGQRPDRDIGGGGTEVLSRFPPRLGTLIRQSISETRSTSTFHAPARQSGQRLPRGGDGPEASGLRALIRRRGSVRRAGRCVLGPAAADQLLRLVAAIFSGRMALLHEHRRSSFPARRGGGRVLGRGRGPIEEAHMPP